MHNSQIEQEIKEKGKTAPRVTPERIQSVIQECHYFTAGDAHRAAWPDPSAADEASSVLGLLTLCVLVLKNGFTVNVPIQCLSQWVGAMTSVKKSAITASRSLKSNTTWRLKIPKC